MPAGAASLCFSRSLWLHFLRPAKRLTQWMRSVFEIFLEASSNLFHSSLQGCCLVPYRKRGTGIFVILWPCTEITFFENPRKPTNCPGLQITLCLLSSHQKEHIWSNIPDHSLVLHSKRNITPPRPSSSKLNCRSQGQQVTWGIPHCTFLPLWLQVRQWMCLQFACAVKTDSCLTPSHLHQTHEHGLASSARLVFDYLCFDARGFINQPSAPRGTSAAGEPGAKIARCSLRHTRLLFKHFPSSEPACQGWFCGRTYL